MEKPATGLTILAEFLKSKLCSIRLKELAEDLGSPTQEAPGKDLRTHRIAERGPNKLSFSEFLGLRDWIGNLCCDRGCQLHAGQREICLRNKPRHDGLTYLWWRLALGAGGHFYMLEKIVRLCSSYEGVTVTCVCNESRCSELADSQAKGDLHGVDLHLEPLFTGPVWYPQDPNFPVRIAVTYEKLRKDFEPFANKLIDLKAKGLPGVPTCVLSDFLLCFTEELADKLGVPWYSTLSVSPAASAVTSLAAPTVCEGLHPVKSLRRNKMLDIPGGKFARVRDISHENVDFPDYWLYHSQTMIRAAGLVFNTAEELDVSAGSLDAIRLGTQLRAKAANRQGPKVFAIGPILNFPNFTGSRSSTIKESSSCPALEFLNDHPASSVLYISFGSVSNILPESLVELAHGLEASGVPFLWALKFKGTLEGAALPPGFTERTKARGYIEEGWAPQAQILLHPSTGGFLSHCGWNSVLESLCSPQPVVTWPIAVDQPINARFVENISKTGVCVKDYTPGDEVLLKPSREDVRRAVRLVMVEEEGNEFRKNAKKWKSVLTEAVEEGGSSNTTLKQFIDRLLLRFEC